MGGADDFLIAVPVNLFQCLVQGLQCPLVLWAFAEQSHHAQAELLFVAQALFTGIELFQILQHLSTGQCTLCCIELLGLGPHGLEGLGLLCELLFSGFELFFQFFFLLGQVLELTTGTAGRLVLCPREITGQRQAYDQNHFKKDTFHVNTRSKPRHVQACPGSCRT